MNKWPNPDAIGEPKFPSVMRTHFLTCSEIQNNESIRIHEANGRTVLRDALLSGVWNPSTRDWLVVGEVASADEVGRDFTYVSPAYTEEEMREAQIDAVDDCMQICDAVYDNSLDDAESKGAMRCGDQIKAYKESI